MINLLQDVFETKHNFFPYYYRKRKCFHKISNQVLSYRRMKRMELESREIEIIKMILEHKVMTVSQIADAIGLSDKTVSHSLKKIQSAFQDEGVKLIRKQSVGVYFEGSKQDILEMLQNHKQISVPSNKEERVRFLCFAILSMDTYWTMQELADMVYVSLTTLEKDMIEVEEILDYYGIHIKKVRGKGSMIIEDEEAKRNIFLKLIYALFPIEWHVLQQKHELVLEVTGIPSYLKAYFNTTSIESITKVLQKYMHKANINLDSQDFHLLIMNVFICLERIKENHYIQGNFDILVDSEFENFISQLEKECDVEISIEEQQYLYKIFNLYTVKSISSVHADERINYEKIENLIASVVEVHDFALLEGFVNHILLALDRISKGYPVTNPFMMDVKKNYPLSFDKAIELRESIEHMFGISIPESEVSFLAIYIQMFKEKQIKTSQKKVLLVCNTGKGTAQLLAAKLRKEFPSLLINRIMSIPDLMNTQIQEDLIISTVDIKLDHQPVLVVNPILKHEDMTEIEEKIKDLDSNKLNFRNKNFSDVIYKEMVLVELSAVSYEDVIYQICSKLVKNGFAKKGIEESALQREKLSFTSFGQYATPHGDTKWIKKSVIVFARLKEEILWGTEHVKFVFFICIKDETPNELENIYDSLLEIIDSGNKRILLKGNQTEVYRYLKGGA